MPRTIDSLARVKGPWGGLNEQVADEMHAPNQAKDVSNVWLHRGAIEARPGYSRAHPGALGGQPTFDGSWNPLPWQTEQIILGTRGNTKAIVVAIVGETGHPTFGQTIRYLQSNGRWTDVPGFATNTRLTSRGSIVPFYPWIYFLFPDDELMLVWRIDDTSRLNDGVRHLGLPPPSGVRAFAEDARPEPVPNEGNFPAGRYGLGLSFYWEEEDLESNGTEANIAHALRVEEDRTFPVPQSDTFAIFCRFSFTGPIPPRTTHVRVYVKAVEVYDDPNGELAGGESTLRLAAEIPTGDLLYDDSAREYYYDLNAKVARFGVHDPNDGDAYSVRGLGPFMPTRNDAPPLSRYATPYRNRMLWGGIDGLVYVSADGRPEYAAPADYLELPDASRGPITHMREYQGRVVVFIESAPFILTGQPNTLTNDQAALGQTVSLEMSAFRAEDGAGCINTKGGVGVIEINGILHVNGPDGIYDFNGLRSAKESEPVDQTWLSIPADARRCCTMANDRRNGHLWIHFGGPHIDADPVVLVYDYRHKDESTGLGRWTKHDLPKATCVGDWQDAEPYWPGLDVSPERLVLLGTSDIDGIVKGLIGFIDERDSLDYDRPVIWSFETGDLDFGLGTRIKRFAYFAVDVNGEDLELVTRVSCELPNGHITTKDLFHVGDRRKFIRQLRLRGTRIRFRFSGTRRAGATDQRIVGYALDVEPIEYR